MEKIELPKRKATRLNGYDYSNPGAYFVTLCTHEKKHLFGEIKNGKQIVSIQKKNSDFFTVLFCIET